MSTIFPAPPACAAGLRQSVRRAGIAQWQSATDRQYEFAIADIIGKLPDFCRIGAREHAGDRDCRIQPGRALRKYRCVAETPTIPDSAKQLGGGLATNGIGDAID